MKEKKKMWTHKSAISCASSIAMCVIPTKGKLFVLVARAGEQSVHFFWREKSHIPQLRITCKREKERAVSYLKGTEKERDSENASRYLS